MDINFGLEHQILLVLYLMSYIAAMLIQIRDAKFKVTFLDWIIALLTSSLGGTLMYFGVMSWANFGGKFVLTIIISIMSPRTFKYLVTDEVQQDFASGFWTGIKSLFQRVFSIETNKNKNDV